MPEITLRLNDESIAAAIKKVKAYETDLTKKAEKIRLEVAKRLEALCKTGFNGAVYDDVLSDGMKVPNVEVYTETDGKITLVIAKGKEAVFVEFGAGVYHNPTGAPHPGRGQGIVGIGEYGHGYGKRKVWGYYDESGERHLTHGTPASMPMYYAAQEVAKMVPDITKKVFKRG